MYEAYVVDGSKLVWLDEHEDGNALVALLRQHWNEDAEGPQTLVVVQGDAVICTLMRVNDDPEVCVTLHATGFVERHRCRYVLDAAGECYDHTEVTQLV